MKKIAITQRVIENDTYVEIRDALDINFASLFQELGLIPVILPTFFPPDSYFENFDISGVILSGGNDLSQVNDNDISAQRDAFEKRVLEHAISKKIPVLGICRGMQLIADYYQADFQSVQNHVAVEHPLIINQTSKYLTYLNSLETVNSYHGYSVKTVPKNFKISAKSQDGQIEAIEHKELPIFGQMWHPERSQPFLKQELSFIKNFFTTSEKG